MHGASNAELLEYIRRSEHGAVAAVNAQGQILVLNPAAESLLGTNSSEAFGKHIEDVVPSANFGDTMESGEEGLHPSQSLGAVIVFQDITEMQRMAEETANLRQVRTLLSAIISAVHDAISVVDAKGNGLLINPAYTRLTGLSEIDVIGKPATVDIAEGASVHMQVLKTRKAVKNVPMKVGPLKRQVVVSVDPVMVGGDLVGSVGVIRDVSELIRLTEEIAMMKKIVRNIESKYTFDEIATESPLLEAAVEQAKRVAATSAPVLLRGESGTGKELFAQAIHGASPRKGKPFVRVNCAALTGDLLEPELFGYANGAFEGAKKGGHTGLFEEAQGGTLFLDEISVMSLPLQESLLKVLQEKEIVKMGGSSPIPVDVRVVAATNCSLEQLVAEGMFREDLYYRLNVTPIFIPPLRQRPEDIPRLCQHLLAKLSQEYGRKVVRIDPLVIDTFRKYRWPGNVRELKNLLGRAMISMGYQDEIITPEYLPVINPVSLHVESTGDKGVCQNDNPHTLQEVLDRVEKRLLDDTLQKCGMNKTKTARVLGISLRGLYNKLEKHGM